MKYVIFALLCLVAFVGKGQTNNFPPTGNVGIGITTPVDQLEIITGNRKIGFNSLISGVTTGGILSLSRPSDGAKIMYLGGAATGSFPNDHVIFGVGGSSEMRFASGGANGAGFGFYSNITATAAFGNTRPAPVMKIDGLGRVGIGTSTPNEKLFVNGLISIPVATATDNDSPGLVANSDDDFLYDGQFLNHYGYGFHTFDDGNGFSSGINTYASGYYGFDVFTAGTSRLRVGYNGNIGVGTVAPAFKLDVEGAGVRFKNSGVAANDYTTFRIQGPSYTHGLEIDFFGNDNMSSDPNQSYGGGAGSASIVNVNAKPLTFGTSNLGRMLIDANGNVGIGTFTPDAKLAVKGTIHTNEVKVDLNGAVAPDYVFENDYNLLSLDDIKTYIDKNKHLPEVPSAKEMEANGVNLGEMNMLLLKKIEELTLHMVEQAELVKGQAKEIAELKRLLNRN